MFLKITDNTYIKAEQIRTLTILLNANTDTPTVHDVEIDFINGGHEIWSIGYKDYAVLKAQLNLLIPLTNKEVENIEKEWETWTF